MAHEGSDLVQASMAALSLDTWVRDTDTWDLQTLFTTTTVLTPDVSSVLDLDLQSAK